MSNDFTNHFLHPDEKGHPIYETQKNLNRPAAKKFYTSVDIEKAPDGWRILLDGKPIRTPAGAFLSVPNERLAQAIAQEWRSQENIILPRTMPITRLSNSAIDGVARDEKAVAAEIKKYFRSDLVCYRASDPPSLVNAQSEAWDPILAFAQKILDAPFHPCEGVIFHNQPEETLKAADHAVDRIAHAPDAAFRLAALHSMTSLTGSALIPLACLYKAVDIETASRIAHLEEERQMSKWGEDLEARARLTARFEEMKAAAFVMESLESGKKQV